MIEKKKRKGEGEPELVVDGLTANVSPIPNDMTKVNERKVSPALVDSLKVNDTLNTLPTLTKTYFKIPSLTAQQKENMQLGETIEGRKKVEQKFFIDDKPGSIILLRKVIPGEKGDAIVREYFDGVPEEFKGFQMFTEGAAYNLGVNDILPSDKELLQMVGKNDDPEHKKSNALVRKFTKENKLSKVGYFSANYFAPVYMNSFRYALLLKDGKHAEIDEHADDIEVIKGTNPKHGFPIMIVEKKQKI